MSIEKEKRLLFGKGQWIWQGSADGSLPIGDSVDRKDDGVDQILNGLRFERRYFLGNIFLLRQVCICRDRLGLG